MLGEVWLQPSSTEGQGVEFILYFRQESFGSRVSYGHAFPVYILIDHIVRAIRSIEDLSFTCWSECLDCKQFTFFHFCLFTSFDNWDTLTSMDGVGSNRMTTEILDRFHWICFVSNLNFMRLHYLLNCSTNVTQAHVNSRCLDTFICCLFGCF